MTDMFPARPKRKPRSEATKASAQSKTAKCSGYEPTRHGDKWTPFCKNCGQWKGDHPKDKIKPSASALVKELAKALSELRTGVINVDDHGYPGDAVEKARVVLNALPAWAKKGLDL